jgi:hypothetical protein
MILHSIAAGFAGIVVAGSAAELGLTPIPAISAGVAVSAMLGYLMDYAERERKEQEARRRKHCAKIRAAKCRQKKWQPNPNYRRLGDEIWESEHKAAPVPVLEVNGALKAEFDALTDEEKTKVLDGTYAAAARCVAPQPLRIDWERWEHEQRT